MFQIQGIRTLIKFDTSRIYGLDILRAAAILFVVLEHGRFLLPVNDFPNKYFFGFKLFLDGVSIFFVLSGYLIGGILIKVLENGRANIFTLTNFWIKRWFRTLPNYFLILIILIIITGKLHGAISFLGITKYFFFVQNFCLPHPDFFNEGWSLSVEEWFYFIIPVFIFVIIALFKLKAQNAVLVTSILFLIFPMIFRYYRFYHIEVSGIDDWDMMFRKQVITRLDSLMFGVIGAYLHHYHSLIWRKRTKIFFSLGIIILIGQRVIEVSHLFSWGIYTCVFSFTVNAIGTVFLLPFLGTVKTGKGLVYKCLTFISLISYSMYLLNLSVIQYLIINSIEIPWLSTVPQHLLKYFFYWFLTISFSFLLYLFYEKPIMNLRKNIILHNGKRVHTGHTNSNDH